MSTFSFSILYSPSAPVQQGISSGGYGIGEWGRGPWGGSAGAPPLISSVSPGVVDMLGGTVVAINGSHFDNSAQLEVISGASVVGLGYIADLDFDLTPSRIYAGMPALDVGFYDLRVTTSGGQFTLTGAIEARPFAYELKVEDVRRKWARAWQTGPRLLGAGG